MTHVSPPPQINWGRGRLMPYESVASVAAKFCKLNGIQPAQFRRFLSTIFVQLDILPWHPSKAESEAIANLLDDPISIVHTLDVPLLKHGRSRVFGEFDGRSFHQAQVRACPYCLRQGYHLVFAEVPWMEKCPLHSTPHVLVDTFDKFGGSMFDRYVKKLMVLMKTKLPDWPTVPTCKISQAQPKMRAPKLRLLTGWLAELEQSIERIERDVVWISHPGDGPTFEDGIGIKRVLSLKDPDVRIRPLIDPCFTVENLQTFSFDRQTSREWADQTATLPPDELIYAYKRTVLPSANNVPFHETLQRCLALIEQFHETCRCSWGWSRYSGWQRVGPGSWPHWGYECPVGIAKAQLIEEWGEFSKVMTKRESMREEAMVTSAVELCKMADAVRIDAQLSAPGTRPPIKSRLKWCMSAKVVQVINIILTSEIEGRTAHILEWLNRINAGETPEAQPKPKGDVVLCYRDDCLFMLVCHTPVTCDH
jgi:hypothetical protein